MKIKASTALRNEYLKISELAHASGEPVYITNKGEADLVIRNQQVRCSSHPTSSTKRPENHCFRGVLLCKKFLF